MKIKQYYTYKGTFPNEVVDKSTIGIFINTSLQNDILFGMRCLDGTFKAAHKKDDISHSKFDPESRELVILTPTKDIMSMSAKAIRKWNDQSGDLMAINLTLTGVTVIDEPFKWSNIPELIRTYLPY